MCKKVNMKKYLNFALTGFLALVMIGSGFNKLRKYNELPSPNFLIEKYSNNSIEYNLEQEGSEIRYNNYKFGLKQSGFFWQLLGFTELVFGLLLFFKRYRFFGSIMLLSITSNIFLMHLFLEPAELGELFYTGFLFAINIYIVLRNKEGIQAIFDKSL